ncbi:MAG: acetyl-CoA carboxylase biotin carboxyl carrier protein subunit [Acidobacteria bacterium]|nr:acetyl-CoA carboxylase biotin carboxyl carrier protein subunit [Acidobacteriota bacterium]
MLSCLVDGKALTADARFPERGVLSLIVEGRQYRAVLDGDAVIIAGQRHEFSIEDPRSLRGGRGAGDGATGPRTVKAPMPGRVVRVLVAVGDEVAETQGVIVIEAMKMQNELKSPKAGRVVKIAVAVDGTVGSGDALVIIE